MFAATTTAPLPIPPLSNDALTALLSNHSANMVPLPLAKYRVGWICALTIEEVAAKAMLDEEHGMIQGQGQDTNTYLAGRIHDHNVVIACLPAGIDGLVAAATVGNNMARTFTNLKFMLLVGIGGGIPSLPNGVDIRLGDVVVSQPNVTSGGVIQYDKGKSVDGVGFIRKGTLNTPPTVLLTAIKTLEVNHKLNHSRIPTYLSSISSRCPQLPEHFYAYPGAEQDRLFKATYSHCSAGGSCDNCDQTQRVHREDRRNTFPQVHYGIIASGNVVVKDPVMRDNLRSAYDALCVEMEAAGLMNDFPCLVIRGICDYADSHKNDTWHRYAAAAAAAYTKELLLCVSTKEQHQVGLEPETAGQSAEELKEMKCLRTFKLSSYEEQKNINPDRAPDTCEWVFKDEKYQKWLHNDRNDLLWISADPGCGKSVFSKSLIDIELRQITKHSICYFFFKDNEKQDNLASALCAILHQLFGAQPKLLKHALPTWQKSGKGLTQEVDEMWRILFAATNDANSTNIICVLDALDECQETDRSRLITKLSEFYIASLSSHPRSKWLKFLVTSRPYDDIQQSFRHTMKSSPASMPTIRLRGEDEIGQIRGEINLVIRAKVAELADDVPLSKKMRLQLEERLLSMENRTYLWLSLAIKSIYETFRDSLRLNDRSIESSIKSLPTSVEDAYEKILNKVKKQQVETVRKILHIIVGARRPLTVAEMSIALGVATSEAPSSLKDAAITKSHLTKNIREWCGLFVFIDNSKIYLVHQTAKEFLIRERDTIATGALMWKHSLDIVDTELLLARTCIESLCITPLSAYAMLKYRYPQRPVRWVIDDDREFNNDAYAFLSYAAQHWPEHFRCADMKVDESLVAKVCQLYDRSGSFMSSSGYVYYPTNRVQKAAFHGHASMLLQFLHQEPSLAYSADNKGQTALAWACAQSQESIVKILLNNGADPNATPCAPPGRHPSFTLSNQAIIHRILDAFGGESWDNHYSPLCEASAKGHVEIVRLLLDAGADIKANETRADGPLYRASRQGHEKMVQLLLDNGADVNARGGKFGVPLLAAIFKGHEKTALTLLRHGADINAVSGLLSELSAKGLTEKVKQLLKIGANRYSSEEYRNAFQAAFQFRQDNVLEVLWRYTGERQDFEEPWRIRAGICIRYWDENFWLSLSSDLDEVKAIIDKSGLDKLHWISPTLARFQCFSRQRYIHLRFLQR